MSNTRNQKRGRLEKAVGCLFPLIGGVLGVAIGIMGSGILEPFVFRMYHEQGNKLGGMFEVGFVSLAIIIASGMTGLISFSYFGSKIRK